LRKAATSARKHGFGEEQWEPDHVSETATRRNNDGSGADRRKRIDAAHGARTAVRDEARLAEFPVITVRRVFHLHLLEIH
jgi:hypothetical protein